MSSKYKAVCINIVGTIKEDIAKYLQWFKKMHEGIWKKKKDQWFSAEQIELLDSTFHQDSYFC